ncbi:MAG: DMT family transporter [Rhodobacteraceae bacterium]|nr:DMT family transporter [Paracoccaceae bacterium]
MARPGRPFLAALWMGGAIVSFTLMAFAARELQPALSTFEIMAWRSLIGFVIVLGLVLRARPGTARLRTPVAGLHALKNLWHFAGQNLWFYGIATIPLAQIVALEFTNPLWVTLLAPLLLGESFTARKAGVAALGFVGVLVVAQPGVSPLGWGHAAGLASALGFAMNALYTRRIMAHDGVLCVLFWMTLMQGVLGFILGAPGGIAVPAAALLPWLAVVGVTGLSAHFALTNALALAPASVVAPMEFLRLPIIALLAAWIYGEPLEAAVFLGGAVILVANLVNLAGVARDGRRAALPGG